MQISVEAMGRVNEALDEIIDGCNQGILHNARASLLNIKCLCFEVKKTLQEASIGKEDRGHDKNNNGGDAA